MSDYFEYSDTLIPGALARAEELAAEFEAIEAGLNLLPTPRGDGLGFAVSFFIPEATQDGHAATWGQLNSLSAVAQAARDGAVAANNNIQNVLLPSFNIDYADFAAKYPNIEPWYNATLAARDKAQLWADELEDVVVESGAYSAKHWATKAAQLTSGARVFIGGWDASGGTMPIATPAIGDKAKFWRITVAGTLPGVGAVAIEDELSINDSLAYEVLPSSGAVQSVAGRVGNVVLTKSDVGLNQVPNYPATSDTDDASTSKLATANGVNTVKGLANTAQTTANGKNKHFYQDATPTATAINDTWTKATSKEMLVWNGAAWEVETITRWEPLITASQSVLANRKYNITATGVPVDIGQPTYAINDSLTLKNTANSDSNVRLLNPLHTIRGPNGIVSPGDDLTIPPGRGVTLVYLASNILEAF